MQKEKVVPVHLTHLKIRFQRQNGGDPYHNVVTRTNRSVTLVFFQKSVFIMFINAFLTLHNFFISDT